MAKLSDKSILTAPFQNVDDINNYVFKTKRIEIESSENYDVALVLGCSIKEIMMLRALEAKMLYSRGVVKSVFLTGGVGFLSKNRDESEANIMKEYMLSRGVSKDDIFTEDNSRDTFENMKNSVAEIENICGKKGKIILVTSDFHEKRSKGILEKMTDCPIYSYGVLDGVHDIGCWDTSTMSAEKMIRKEAFLLSWYTHKGIIDDQEVTNVRTRR